jgi:two-component system, cell cycle sensor histidine kinase and response regulator CckA
VEAMVEGVVRRLGLDAGTVRLESGVTVCEREDLERSWVEGDLLTGRFAYLEVTFAGNGRTLGPADLVGARGGPAAVGENAELAPILGAARAHRGAVTVRGVPERGLAVRVLLPLVASAEGNGTVAGNGRTVGLALLVDDDSQVRAVAQKMFEMQGFEVLTACNGAEGVEVFRRHSNDVTLVVLDLAMPVMGGEEAFREIRRIRGDARVVLSTGYDEAQARERLASEGLAGFIQKPYRLAALRETVRRLLLGP